MHRLRSSCRMVALFVILLQPVVKTTIMATVRNDVSRVDEDGEQVEAHESTTVTIHNDMPRLDVNGEVVDAHDGMILEHNGTFFLYGEAYGNQSLSEPLFTEWKRWPRLAVYTSPDMVTWTYQARYWSDPKWMGRCGSPT